ncbi:hypothetical protein OAO01_09685, partial [Oligoflexia bacterium]|nr:hypothetical protein [Oligoflexia bacterium]
LNGSGSYDPDGGQLSYFWETDCEGSELVASDYIAPKLNLTLPGKGQSQFCGVTLTVSDGELDKSCSATIAVNSCGNDCLGVPNGAAKLDQCGVCNGNNACLDCAGMPFGSNIFDDQDIAQCCLPTEIDECGVCLGNNATCAQLECIEVSYGDEISALLEANVKKQKLLRKKKREHQIACFGNKRLKRNARQTGKGLKNNESLLATFPSQTDYCEGDTSACVSTDLNEGRIDCALRSNQFLTTIKRLVNSTYQCRADAGSGTCEGCERAKTGSIREARGLHQDTLDTLNNLPNSILNCQ